MFGGLEVKGSDAKKERPAPSAPATGPFSCLAVAPAAAHHPAPPAAAAGSAFSFLNAAPAAEVAVSAYTPAGPTMSSFSFLQVPATSPQSLATTKIEGERPALVNSVPPVEHTGAASSFPSSIPSLGPLAEAKVEENTSDPMIASSFNGSSAFSFLEPAASTSDTSIASVFATAVAPFAPAGAGISFGGASVTAARQKKKKNRALKVGIGASIGSPRCNLPPLTELPKLAEDSPTHKQSGGNTRLDALDAARRAEEFMNKKLQEQTAAELETVISNDQGATVKGAAKSLSGGRLETTYDDEMIAAAAAAAVEAQARNQKLPSGGARSIMGGLFRRGSPPTSSSNLSIGGSSSRSGSFSSTSGSRLPRPTSVEIDIAKPSSGNSLSSDDCKPSASSYPPAVKAASAAVPVSVQQGTIAGTCDFLPALPPKPVPKRGPPKPKTPEDELNAMLQTFRRNVETAMGKVTLLRQQRSRLLEERNSAMTQVRLATQQKDLTEQQLTAAVEAEEFDAADELGCALNSYEKEQQECSRMLDHIGMAIRELESQRMAVAGGVHICFETIKKQLQDFEAAQETTELKSDDTFSRKFSSMTKHLATEHERLQNDLKHLGRDEELVTEERNEVETAISEQSCDFEKDRDEAKEKLTIVEGEIEELRKQIQAKQAIAAQLRCDVAGLDDSILQVRLQFSRQLQRVHKKEKTIEDHRKEWEAEKRIFQREKDEHEADAKAHSEAMVAHEKLMGSLKKEIAVAGLLELFFQKDVWEVDTTADPEVSDESGESDLLGLQAEVVKGENVVREAREALKVATSTLQNLETELGALIARIPELEAVKKAAAAKRDFKAAGKASKEIKDAAAKVKECQDELTGEALERKIAAENELKNQNENLQKKRQVALEKEKITGIITMKKLADRIRHLVETKMEICGEDYAPEQVQGVGAFVLQEQINFLALEGKALGEKYGVWDELIAGVCLSNVAAAKKANKSPESGANQLEEAAKVDSQVNAVMVVETEPTKPPGPKACMTGFRRLTQDLKAIEVKIEIAAEEENYEVAAELDEKLQGLMAELEAFNLTDAEIELALLGDDCGEREAFSESSAVVTEDGWECRTPAEAAAAAFESANAMMEDASACPCVEGQSEAGDNEEQQLTQQVKSMDSAADEHPKSVTPCATCDHTSEPTETNENASGDHGSEPTETKEEIDEKKTGYTSPIEDGFVAVDNRDF